MPKIAFSDLRVMSLLPAALAPHLEPDQLEKVFRNIQDNLFEGYPRPSKEALWATTQKCRRCPKATGPAEMPMWNLKDPKILFITETKPTMAKAIETFMSALKQCKFSSSDVCLSYMIRCPFEKPGHEDEDIERCSEYLWTEVVALSPLVVVPMGAKVTSFFVPSDNISGARGQEYWIGPWRFFPTFSPSYVAMAESNKIETEFLDDMNKIRSLIS